jgi:ABC-type multidrug transport system fused ATPase/permease subunit
LLSLSKRCIKLLLESGQNHKTLKLNLYLKGGKSTCIQLLQRFYDPASGNVKIDGIDIKDLNLNWLRTHIGVVNQEPILFASSIADNIRMGKDGVTQDEIELAAKNANAHDFISSLPNVSLS